MKFLCHGLWVIISVQALLTDPSNSAGAIAVGIAPDGAQHGFSYGLTSNQSSEADAQAAAINGCRMSKESNEKARSRCTLVRTYTDQCGAIAMDPKDGTPGVGWNIAATATAANQQAVANCEATAGPSRAGACKVSATRCDGTAK
jgi:hypothetical protein